MKNDSKKGGSRVIVVKRDDLRKTSLLEERSVSLVRGNEMVTMANEKRHHARDSAPDPIPYGTGHTYRAQIWIGGSDDYHQSASPPFIPSFLPSFNSFSPDPT
jgi:hypothetical protein